MAHPSAVRWINLGIRAATLGSRFLFVFLLARFVEPEVVGQYGLLYLIFLPLSWLLFSNRTLPLELTLWFYLLAAALSIWRLRQLDMGRQLANTTRLTGYELVANCAPACPLSSPRWHFARLHLRPLPVRHAGRRVAGGHLHALLGPQPSDHAL